MTDAPTPPEPGQMTVPPLFGWEQVAVVLVLLVVVLVVVAVVAAARAGRAGRAEWQGWLDARPSRRDAVVGRRDAVAGRRDNGDHALSRCRGRGER